ncbi:MAG: hypothetical protein ACOZF0_10135 [Thermodesulfobacteriota bacterium]
MLPRPRRKERYPAFPLKANLVTVLLLSAVFGMGFHLSLHFGLVGPVVYLALWALSYPLIYAGACRYCAYYGNRCPIPLEGSCVHRFVKPKRGGFGYPALAWATFAYGLRLAVPAVAIVAGKQWQEGLLFGATLSLFWLIHLRVSGCPNCINTDCPLNPDYRAGNGGK